MRHSITCPTENCGAILIREQSDKLPKSIHCFKCKRTVPFKTEGGDNEEIPKDTEDTGGKSKRGRKRAS